MFEFSRKFSELFVAVLILLTGHGLQLTLVPLRARELGFTPTDIGLIGSAYFFGFVVGCLIMPRIVSRVGHIRAFSITTTLCGVALLALLLTSSIGWWSLARSITGISICGAYLVIESWLNEQTPEQLRGRVLAAYTAAVLVAMCVGQLIISQGHPLDMELVVVGAILLSLAVIPVSLTPSQQPSPPENPQVSLLKVYRTSRTAFVGSGLIGMATGVIFTMAPVQARDLGMSVPDTAIFMLAILIGGAAFQWPAGRYSDAHDRRVVMTVLLTIASLAAVGAVFVPQPLGIIALMFISGGATLAIYPICLAHANDRATGNFLEIGTGILLANATGSMIGPLLAAVVIGQIGTDGFFGFLTGVYVVAGGFMVVSIRKRDAVSESEHFINAVSSSPGVIRLDPRAHETEPDEQN